MAGEFQITYERQDDEMIAIIDYDAGNIKSVEKAMQLLGQEVTITRDRETIMNADKVILPGVGAFGDAMGKLRQYGLDEVIRDVTAKGTPFLGICLGLQLLFERSDETPGVEGLGILKGEILRIPDQEGLKIPHMGWNSLKFQNNGRLFKDIPEDSYVYFVHSYYLKAQDREIVSATTTYGIELDVHLSTDGKLVVFHDDDLSRICGRPEAVEVLPSKELQRCRLQDTTETIPLFSEVLSLVDGQVPLLIELKIPKSSLSICEKTWEALKNYNGPYMVQSFNTLGIWWFRRHAPHVLRGQLSSNLTADNLPEPWILTFIVKHLLGNVLGRPDFISYKLADLPRFEVWFLKHILHLPIAVWTLRTPDALKKGTLSYDMQIFEKKKMYY